MRELATDLGTALCTGANRPDVLAAMMCTDYHPSTMMVGYSLLLAVALVVTRA